MPDTYRISPDASVSVVIETLLQTFDDRVYKAFDFQSPVSLYETLIFASILEKEEKNSINKPVVAGILKKRYDEKMALGADATVCYAYRLTMTECTPAFIGEHIYKKTLYNTRDSR
jgi:cell division protein YceG involved in septum cleavage